MSYIERDLMEGERLVHRTGLHPVVYLRPASWLLGGAVLAALLLRRGLALPGLAVAAAALAASLPVLVRLLSSEYGVTNRRVFVKAGWIGRHTLETALSKVGVIVVDQTPLGRVLGYGTLTLRCAGGASETLPRMRSPHAFRNKVFEQLEEPPR